MDNKCKKYLSHGEWKLKEYNPYPTMDGKKRVTLDKAGFFMDYGRLDIPQYHYEEVRKYFITENRTKELTISFYRVKKGQKPESILKNMQESMIYSIRSA